MDRMPLVYKRDAPEEKSLIELIHQRIDEMNAEQFRQSLIDAGVIDEDGKLTEPYRKKDDDD